MHVQRLQAHVHCVLCMLCTAMCIDGDVLGHPADTILLADAAGANLFGATQWNFYNSNAAGGGNEPIHASAARSTVTSRLIAGVCS